MFAARGHSLHAKLLLIGRFDVMIPVVMKAPFYEH